MSRGLLVVKAKLKAKSAKPAQHLKRMKVMNRVAKKAAGRYV